LYQLSARFIIFIVIIYGFLFSGYALKLCYRGLGAYSRELSRYIVIFLSPIITINALWSLEIQNARFASLPFLLAGMQLFAIIPALIIARLLKSTPGEKGSIIACSMFSNNGYTLGNFLCLLFFGDEGLYLGSWFIALFLPVYYLIGFPIASILSGKRKMGLKSALIELTRDPVSIVPISSMALGMLLNLSGLPRPAIVNTIASHYVTYILVACSSIAIGIGLNFTKSLKYVKHALFIALVKFCYTPLTGTLLLFLFGYLRMENSLPAEVVLLQSFMPSAIMAVILAKLFSLNSDLANAAWILTNLFVIPLIPAALIGIRFFT